jgi:hypothetical protein
MSKETLVLLGGMILIVTPFLGIPEVWTRALVIGTGVIFLIIGYRLRRGRYLATIDRGNGERGTDSFVETTAPLFEDRPVQ